MNRFETIRFRYFNDYFVTDECEQLALTVSRVMEEAGDKVEGNIDEIKTNYSQRMNKLEDIIKKVWKFSQYCLRILVAI